MYEANSAGTCCASLGAEIRQADPSIEEAARLKAREYHNNRGGEAKTCGVSEETISMITDQITDLLIEIRDMADSIKIIIKDEPRVNSTGGPGGPERKDLYTVALRQRSILADIRDSIRYIGTALR